MLPRNLTGVPNKVAGECIYIYTVSVYLYKHKHISYHHRKDYGSSGSFDDPEKQQAAELDNGEHVNLS